MVLAHIDLFSGSSGSTLELCKGSYLQSATGSFPEMPWTCLKCQRNANFAGWGKQSLQYNIYRGHKLQPYKVVALVS